MSNEEKIKEKFMEFQMVQKQIEQVNEHLQMLQQRSAELESTKKAIETLGETEVDKEILASVANGIFIKAELKDNKKLVVNVGADVTVEKTVPQVIKLLEEQEKKISEGMKEAGEVFEQLQAQAMKFYQEVEAMQE